jgi:gluconate 2-dehydrogenase gamma chain
MNRRDVLQRAAMVLGYAITGPSLVGILQGCKATPELAFNPTFFTKEQALVVAELAEVILPKTDTPGAKDAGVPAFIDQMLKNVYSEESQKAFVKNLEAFDNEARETFGSSFAGCNESERVELVKKHHEVAFAGGVEKRSHGFWNAAVTESKPFILEFKELTIVGFFTSEAGATQVLQYKAVPGPYKGCVPLADVGRSWAT